MPKTLVRLVLVALLAAPVVATAQSRTASELQRARMALATYDVEGDGTLSVLRQLGSFVRSDAPEDQRREARFLRAMAATDLLIVSAIVTDEELPRRVASALGVADASLLPFLDSELAAVRTGPYVEPSVEAAACLRAVRGEPVDFASFRGNRRDALFVRSTARALRGAPDSLPVFASLGRDPCGADASCSGPEGVFPADVRRALSVSSDLRQSLRRLERAVASGDPVSPYVSDDVLTVKQALSSVVGHPTILLPATLSLASVAGGPSVPDVDILVVVGARTARHAFLPMIASDEAHGPHVDSLGQPTLPTFGETRLPAELPSETAPIGELVTELRAAVAGGRRVAVAAEPSAPCHLVARAIRSVTEAGGLVVGLAGRAPDGSLRVVALAASSPGGDVAAHVFVRSGGYDVEIGRTHTSISRVRVEGGYQFDVAGLERVLRERTFPTASVRFANGVAFEALAGAVSRLRSEAPLELLLPR